MKRGRVTADHVTGLVTEPEAGISVADLPHRHGGCDVTGCTCKAKHGGVGVSKAKRRRGHQDETLHLKRVLADAMLDDAALQDLRGQNGSARRAAPSGRTACGEPWDARGGPVG